MWHRFGGRRCNGCAKGLGAGQVLSNSRWMDPLAAHMARCGLELDCPGLAYLGATARLSGAERTESNR